ncbi:armadillo-type protein [Fimicolochytrium jonesii]|uniref:armadillo-type protein n=1 Tax=Fimicolochytrium jonesii TaxID=1396493 RepID=UPI0022FDECB9|nr:armadillo-type protein [Fimicolochytrium jonesii]KAI8822171.1 armadillo-type protein [Fimicolochytrium jonesii]
MFEFAKSAISGALTSKGPALPFSVGEPVHFAPLWTIHDGVKKDDRSPVSVFVFDIQRNRDKLPLARNALKKCRTIRHPDLLKVYEGVETETKIIIGTEHVTPLNVHNPLRSLNPNLIAWGLYKVAWALKFLNGDCKMIHGNLRVDSIFTTKAGEWKVGGLDLLSNLEKEDNPVLLSYGGHMPDSHRYAPPEVRRSSWSACRTLPPHAVDSWAFGCLVHEIFNGVFSRPEDLGAKENIPSELYPLFKSFLSPDPTARMTMADFLEKGLWKQGYLDKDFISVTLFLEQIAIKDAFEKDQFLKKIDMSLDTFPTEFCKYKILPELIKALEFGGAGAKALGPILKLGGKLEQEEFDSAVVPIIVKLFASTDRAIRVSLCEGLPSFVNNLNAKIVTEKIFPNLAMGFMDTSAVIREQTLKSVLVVIPKLSEKIINNDLLRYLAKLQQDEEPGIRTNTTICLGKISKNLNEATKKKVLVPAFLRSLSDPFPPSRTAGLAALAATIESYTPQDSSQRIIPAISLLLLDPERSVRKQAFNDMELFVKKLEKIADSMPETATPAATEAPGTQPAAAGSEGWAGWAMSAVSSKLTASVTPSGSNPDLKAASGTGTPPSQSSRPSAATPALVPESINRPAPMVSAAMAPLVPTATATPASNGWDTATDGWGWGADPILPSSTPQKAPSSFGFTAAQPFSASQPITKPTDNWATFPPPSSSVPSPGGMVLQPTKAWETDGWGADGWDIDAPVAAPAIASPALGGKFMTEEEKERRRQVRGVSCSWLEVNHLY